MFFYRFLVNYRSAFVAGNIGVHHYITARLIIHSNIFVIYQNADD